MGRRRYKRSMARNPSVQKFSFRIDLGNWSTIPTSSTEYYVNGVFPITTGELPADFKTLAGMYRLARVTKLAWTFQPSINSNTSYYNSTSGGGIYDGPINYQFGQVGILASGAEGVESISGGRELALQTWADCLSKKRFKIFPPTAMMYAKLKYPTFCTPVQDAGLSTTIDQFGKLKWFDTADILNSSTTVELGRAMVGCKQPNSNTSIGEYSGQTYGVTGFVTIELKYRGGF